MLPHYNYKSEGCPTVSHFPPLSFDLWFSRWVGRETIHVKEHMWTHPTPTPPEHFSFSTLAPHEYTRQTLIIQKQDDVLKLEADPMKTDKANEI